MQKFFFSALCGTFLLCGCQSEAIEIDFSTLPEPEKRLLANAPASFTLHEGLVLQTFAGEPMLANPTNLDIDERGRAWVCTAQNYRRFNHDHPAKEGGDQILILEDTDGDGKADRKKVFFQGVEVNAALGIAKLGKKVYVAASPNMLVFTDADGDDVPEKLDTLFTGLEGVDHDHGVHAIVFGPDGKLYFNFGNEGKRLRLKDGRLVVDRHGNTVEEGQGFRQGMIFRCNADGSDLEIMAHNFRNNYEVALDAYGRMWQSDNDDDGNEGTRINFVMDYGNYGFRDEVTGAAWQESRVGMHDEIPKRHWHLNDPGVVPNLLQTGSGSPTGILVYEGNQLPGVFQGQMIHCEPGHNVVRAYPVKAKGAGFSAEVVPLMTSSDSWFRPADVCAAPDGSLLVADWYDSGVGGHLMGDIQRGRIYRLHGEGQEGYFPTPPDLSTVAGAAAALGHVNQATRFLAYQSLVNDPSAEEVLQSLLLDPATASRDRARCAWALAALRKDGTQVIKDLLATQDPLLQETALRLARQYPGQDNADLYAASTAANNSDQKNLWREAALSLRYLSGEKADQAYAALANKYDGQDRWYLEALGIGADRFANTRFAAWLQTQPDLDAAAARKLVWRSRADQAPELYLRYIQSSEKPEELASFFRALHFHKASAAKPVLETALFTNDHPKQDEIIRYALSSISAEALRSSPRLQQRLKEVMPSIRGSDVWTMIIDNAELKSEIPALLEASVNNPDNNFQDKAAKLIARIGGIDYVKQEFAKRDALGKDRLIHLARHMQDGATQEWLKELRADEDLPQALRNRATNSLANYWNGMPYLMDLVESGELSAAEAAYTARVMTQCWRTDQRSRAIEWLTENRQGEAIDLEAVLAMKGNLAQGKAVYTEYCAACHQVGDEGVRYGPNLNKIGDKLGKDALLAAIAYPSQGIGFGYEGYTLEMADGKRLTGYIESQTENELSLRMMGGVTQTVKKNDIVERTSLAESLMTAGLHELMEAQELADLLSYLEQLKEAELSR